MNANTLNHLQYFKDKVCSIITTAMNRNFTETITREHFVIRVGDVSVDGVWGYHPYNLEMVSFFRWEHIISIHQEYELDPNDPEHAKIVAEYEKKTGKKVKSDVPISTPLPEVEKKTSKELLPILNEKPATHEDDAGDAMFINIENLEKLAEDTKRSYASYESFRK